MPERGGEAEQQRRAVPEPGQGGGVDRLEQPLKRIKLERFGLAHRAGAALPANPGNDRGHGARVTRVGMVLGAVTGGDRRRPAGDRHRAELAVGLGGQECGGRFQRRQHRLEGALGAPGGE